MAPVLEDFRPDYLFVHGDTTTSAFAALACYYAGIEVYHVEAGLRTFNINSPFPEEINRQFTARIAAIHFAPTSLAKDNLIKEGIDPVKIHVTGNTIIDALMYASEKVDEVKDAQIEKLKIITAGRKTVLVTCHRRENFGQGLENICAALKEISQNKEVNIIYPVHLNPRVRNIVYDALANIPNIHLVPPLEYPAFIWLMKSCRFIITDSGGIQEEGIALSKSILLLRENTERPEVIESGWVKIVGSDKNTIVREANNLLENGVPEHHSGNLYGSGDTSEQIISIIRDLYV
jgi:UDP-N-acetylglucosamine 2-epimerase (non-hydrolysing)